MDIEFKQILIYILGFAWILLASDYFARFFKKIRLPLVTGFLVTGIICGPHLLNLVQIEALGHLNFVNDIALAFIAFAAGAELYLKDIRSRIRSIVWNTIGQVAATFIVASVAVYFLADYIPFMHRMSMGAKIAVSILAATIFIARSPSAAIAVISEMRAKGPFTQTALSVTVIIDVVVIALFSICFSIAVTLVTGDAFNLRSFGALLLGLALAVVIGYGLGKIISFILSLPIKLVVRSVLILAAGYGMYLLSNYFGKLSLEYLTIEIHVEPLLICIVASFIVTNYSKYRQEFRKVIHNAGPLIYVAFFTLIGASFSIDILVNVWFVALILFMVRLVAMIIGSYAGSTLAKDPAKYKSIGWLPYVTQAGVSLGLATQIAGEFPDWGAEFATIIIAVIVLNQLIGPPLFKWAIHLTGEAHLRAETPKFDGQRDALIFGLENQSLALARQLQKHDWGVKIATLKKMDDITEASDVYIESIDGLTLKNLKALDAGKAETIVLMLSDEENAQICELVYEKIGTKDIVVRLNERANFKRFHQLGAVIMEPSTAMVSLLDHLVRAPMATSLLMGMDADHDSEDIIVLDKSMHGMALRDLRLPTDVLILSVKRKGHMVVTHGYTRLRLHDVITVVGSEKSLEELRLKFEVSFLHN